MALTDRQLADQARTDRQRETEADMRLYVEIGLAPVTCQACGVEVAVKKNSQKHTSVQWTAEAMAGCQEFADADPAVTALRLGCGRLKASIDAAVRDGAVVVPDA
ncbi:hypothetical protein [Jatrophihabitans sp.]|uniref:hypothetical protein n=1 Tax=Jatrophihabitans sp. TaxID=1932789 RepID=UPI0030C6F5F7|nr:hypothetical protein [Jatrophihabitans sp.]